MGGRHLTQGSQLSSTRVTCPSWEHYTAPQRPQHLSCQASGGGGGGEGAGGTAGVHAESRSHGMRNRTPCILHRAFGTDCGVCRCNLACLVPWVYLSGIAVHNPFNCGVHGH
jgi:hypothetical protein